MQEYGVGTRVVYDEVFPGVVTEVNLYPDGDLHYYVVHLDDGRDFECGNFDLERE